MLTEPAMTRSLPIPVLMLSFALAACTQPPSPAAGDVAGTTPPTEPAKAMPNDALGGYDWRLQDATDAQGQRIAALLVRPGQPISFDVVDGRIRIANACNAMVAKPLPLIHPSTPRADGASPPPRP